jgi:Copper chaperone
MGLFSKSNETVVIKVLGMTCPHCSKAVETALMELEDVKKAKVALADGIVTVTLKKDVDIKILAKAIDEAGFKAEI